MFIRRSTFNCKYFAYRFIYKKVYFCNGVPSRLRLQCLAEYGNVQTNSKIKDFNNIHDEKNKFISCGGGSVVCRAVILQQRQQL